MSESNGGEVRVFRGRSLEEVLPQIREELGPDAIITRQREGLQGGIAGFFQKQFVEIEARAGVPASGPVASNCPDATMAANSARFGASRLAILIAGGPADASISAA